MREPDIHYEQQIALDVEDTTQNLSQNLHLKWNYGLLFVDKYTDEQGQPVSVVSGIRREDETTYYMRVHMTQENKSTYAKVDLWKVMTSGWPLPTGVGIGSPSSDKLIDLVDDIMRFCETPFENTSGVVPWLRSIFTGRSEARNYEN